MEVAYGRGRAPMDSRGLRRKAPADAAAVEERAAEAAVVDEEEEALAPLIVVVLEMEARMVAQSREMLRWRMHGFGPSRASEGAEGGTTRARKKTRNREEGVGGLGCVASQGRAKKSQQPRILEFTFFLRRRKKRESKDGRAPLCCRCCCRRQQERWWRYHREAPAHTPGFCPDGVDVGREQLY